MANSGTVGLLQWTIIMTASQTLSVKMGTDISFFPCARISMHIQQSTTKKHSSTWVEDIELRRFFRTRSYPLHRPTVWQINELKAVSNVCILLV